MKKKLLVVLTGVMLFGVAACGAAEQLAEDAKEDIEWTKENGALTNGRSSDEQLAETVEDLTGADISFTDEESGTTSTGKEHEIGDTVSVTSVNSDGTETNLDITVTGYDSVYNGEATVTAIYYIVTSKDGSEMQFENSYFTCYADNKFVEPEGWGDYNPFSYGVLMPGTSYEGCYVADVDPKLVNNIDLYIGDSIWHIQKEEIPVQADTTYDVTEGLALAGLYSDGVDTCDVSFYSVPDGYYVGTFSATMDGKTYSGELEYDDINDCYYATTDSLDTICLFFGEDSTVEVYVDSEDGTVNYWSSPMPMTQHYES